MNTYFCCVFDNFVSWYLNILLVFLRAWFRDTFLLKWFFIVFTRIQENTWLVYSFQTYSMESKSVTQSSADIGVHLHSTVHLSCDYNSLLSFQIVLWLCYFSERFRIFFFFYFPYFWETSNILKSQFYLRLNWFVTERAIEYMSFHNIGMWNRELPVTICQTLNYTRLVSYT